MLDAIATLLIVAWFVGEVSGYASGGLIYLLLTLGIVLLVVRLVGSQRTGQSGRSGRSGG